MSYVRYDMVDEIPMGNQSLTDIMNLKQHHNLFIIVFCDGIFFKDYDFLHSHKKIMKPFAFAKPHDFRVFTKEYS